MRIIKGQRHALRVYERYLVGLILVLLMLIAYFSFMNAD